MIISLSLAASPSSRIFKGGVVYKGVGTVDQISKDVDAPSDRLCREAMSYLLLAQRDQARKQKVGTKARGNINFTVLLPSDLLWVHPDG